MKQIQEAISMARFSFAPARSAGRAAAAPPQHAIVLGGSMAGLITARVLAGHFDRVTIVERDQLPAGAVQRPGVPQARHAHILLTRGIRILEQLFPGLGDDLVAAGAARLSTTQEIGMLLVDRWAPAYPSPLYAYAASRNLLETLVRRRLRADSRVVFREGQEAAGLLAAPAGGRVTGFHLRGRGPAAGATEDLVADLVVDATGRTSHAPDWLEALGYGRPAETVVTAHAGYASRLYRFPTGSGQSIYGAWKGLATMPSAPHNPRAAVILPIEGDQWVVTLAGTNQAYAPTDEAGFLQFARSLPDPAIGELLARASRSHPSPATGAWKTAGTITNACRAGRLASPCWAMPQWPSTRCMPRA
jgi:2-polyprenyl-6-methoxyphenol hydroxylase-like FAD-dependent oxidoreductase